MEKCATYVKGGPSYHDQMYDRFMKYFNSQDIVFNKFEPIWDEAMTASEEVHNERIRNILSPLLNIVCVMEEIVEDDTVDEGGHPNRNKKIELVKKVNLIDSCHKAIQRLLDVPHQ